MAEFATKGVAGSGLGLGIAGTALGLLNGGLGNVLGGGWGNGMGWGNPGIYGGTCSESTLVNRYEAAQAAKIEELTAENKLLSANIYTDSKLLDLYRYFDGELKDVRGVLGAQAVMNQKTADSFEMVHNDMLCCKNELYSAIARERDERCCGDNAIIGYLNSTFYPKMVSDVTVGTTSTAQLLYNPLPNCGCCK